jgi:hypothetical protein
MGERLALQGGAGDMKAVSAAPSINLTPMGPLQVPAPYPVIADLTNALECVEHVRFNGRPAMVLGQSYQPACKGDGPGTGKGVKSGTLNGEVRPTAGSSTVRVNNKPLLREGDPCTMQGGNTEGIYVTAPAPASAPLPGPGSPVPSFGPPPGQLPGKHEEILQAMKELKAEAAYARWHPIEAMDRRIEDLRARIGPYQRPGGGPEVTDDSKPRTLTSAERDDARVRAAIKDYIARKQFSDNCLAFAMAGAAPYAAGPMTYRGETESLNRSASLDPAHPKEGIPSRGVVGRFPQMRRGPGDSSKPKEVAHAMSEAVNQASEFVVPQKHLPEAGGRWAKFVEGTNPNDLVREALNGGTAKITTNTVADSYKVVADLGRTIGTKGETSIRVIIGKDGKIWTAFPVK